MKQLSIIVTLLVVFSCDYQTEKSMKKSTDKKIGTIELVIFKTKPEFTQTEFIKAAKAVKPIIEKFEGYLGRKLAVNKEGIWTDIVLEKFRIS